MTFVWKPTSFCHERECYLRIASKSQRFRKKRRRAYQRTIICNKPNGMKQCNVSSYTYHFLCGPFLCCMLMLCSTREWRCMKWRYDATSGTRLGMGGAPDSHFAGPPMCLLVGSYPCSPDYLFGISSHPTSLIR